MAPAHPSPCEPRVRALPLPGLRGDLVAWVSAAHPGGCNPAAAARTNNLIATTHDNERTCGTFDSKSAPSPANGAPNRVPATGHHVARVARVSAAHPGDATPRVFNGPGSPNRRANRPFSTAPAHPSPCQPRVRALPLPGLPVEFDGVGLAGLEEFLHHVQIGGGCGGCGGGVGRR